MKKKQPAHQKLVDKYRPRRLEDLRGQPYLVHQLSLWLEEPCSCAFLFSGGTGTGKTSAAHVLAAELGVALDAGDFGGLHTISSGEQTGESVRRAVRDCAFRPFCGSGWHVLIVNEADAMTPGAAFTWLDALENLPARTVVIFTTNNVQKLPQRLRDRCEHFAFISDALLMTADLQDFAGEVWMKETGRDDCPDVGDFGPVADADGSAGFRRLLQQMEPFVRAARPAKAKRARKRRQVA